MAKPGNSHFFISPDGITVTESFGPVSPESFRLTTTFTATATAKAFSICKGIILVQPQVGSTDKVNVILRPFTQPFPGLNIKYFVYRGLKKEDFFTIGSNPLTIAAASASSSDFITKIHADFDAFYEHLSSAQSTQTPKPAFTAQYIGYDEAVTDDGTVLLSDFFFKESKFVEAGSAFDEQDAFELPMLDSGKSLGHFAAGECGIDVVLNYGDYKHDFDSGEFAFNLSYARAIKAAIIPNGTDVQKKIQREQISQFIDIAAFYGLFVKEGKVTVDTAGTKTEKTGLQIYQDVVALFPTKNRWYIYIQSDRSRSYNFYNNYRIADNNPMNLKIGLAANALADAYYVTQNWPLLINEQQQAVTDGTNKLFLQLVTDNNNNTALYGQTVTIKNEQQNNFCNADDLRLPPDAAGTYGRLTKIIEINSPGAVDGKNVATFSLLLYQGATYSYLAGTATNENDETQNVYAVPNFFDDVFDLIAAKPLLNADTNSGLITMVSERLNIVNQYYDSQQQGLSVVQTITVNDFIETDTDIANQERVSYITEAIEILRNPLSPKGTGTQETKASSSTNGSVSSRTYLLPEPYYYEMKNFTDETQIIRGIQLKTKDGTIPSKIILGITKSENELLKSLLAGSVKNAKLFLLDLYNDYEQLVSIENINYQKYLLGIVGEVEGKLTQLVPASNIIVYSIDRNYHFSKGYSQFIQISNTINADTVDDKIIIPQL